MVAAGAVAILAGCSENSHSSDPDAGVYPMVGPGLSYSKMITGDFIVSRDLPDDEQPGPSEMF